MREIFLFLKNNPLVLVIVVAWIAGAIGNVVKAAKKARERAERAQRELPAARRTEPGEEARSEPRAEPRGAPRPIRADEIAAEMRRILRGEPERPQPHHGAREPSAGDVVAMPEQPAPPPLPRAQRTQQQRSHQQRSHQQGTTRSRNAAPPERPPLPVVPSTSARRLQIHVDPHVGEGISRRASVRSGHVGEHALGQLGGRVHGHAGRRTTGSRYSLDDLKRVIVMNEILGPPLALRGFGGRDV